MTTETEGKPDDQAPDQAAPADQGQGDEAEVELMDDNDPMLAPLRETAEAAKSEADQPKPAEEPAKEPTAKAEGQPAKEAAPAPEKGKPIMIPKARFDQVLSEREVALQQATYLQGVIAAQKQMLEAGKSVTTGNAVTEPVKQDHNTLIAKAEDDKLALAQKYEDGEISYLDMQKGIVALDKQIRAHDEARVAELVEGAKQTANATVQASNRENAINATALEIQKQHPYVAEIDKLPPKIRDGLWGQIGDEAAVNLAQRGINVGDGSLNSHVAWMSEKARLADVYGPQFTGKQIAPVGDQPATKQPSEKAQQRAAKLDMSQQQPPSTQSAAVGGHEGPSLTEKDIENMTPDQLADIESTRPGLLAKVVGLSAR